MSAHSEPTSKEILNDLHKWVSAALNLNIEKYDLKIIQGTDEEGDHYLSDIVYVVILAEHLNGEKQEYNMVIKYGQRSQKTREKLPIRALFERELDVYGKLIPFYHKFQKEKNLPLFAYAPKCYLTKFTDTEEVIIFENVKQMGYILHDPKIPLDVNQIKLILEAYAELHALSFALKERKDKDFLEVIKRWTNVPWKRAFKTTIGEIMDRNLHFLYEVLEESGEIELLRKYKEKNGNREARVVLRDLLGKEETQTAVLHGDCWSNNFLFKYEDETTKQRCTNVAVLDFQMSYVQSPVFDLCHFIYAVASEDELKHFRELIDHYYNHFSEHMRRFGSDPNSVFSYSDLIGHWQKYSAYGAVFNPLIVWFLLVEKEDGLEIDKEADVNLMKKVVQTQAYKKRVMAVAKHFVEFSF